MIIKEMRLNKEHLKNSIMMTINAIIGLRDGLTIDEIFRKELERRGIPLPEDWEENGRLAEGVELNDCS